LSAFDENLCSFTPLFLLLIIAFLRLQICVRITWKTPATSQLLKDKKPQVRSDSTL